MRKQIIDQVTPTASPAAQNWLDLNQLAKVELTSEDEAHPIEEALITDNGTGWMAAQAGKQTIRIVFDAPQKINHILLSFIEKKQARTQEFVLRWLPVGGSSYKEIVRQQYNFSPPQTIEEQEEYAVNLEQVINIELTINPTISGGTASATLAKLRMR